MIKLHRLLKVYIIVITGVAVTAIAVTTAANTVQRK